MGLSSHRHMSGQLREKSQKSSVSMLDVFVPLQEVEKEEAVMGKLPKPC